MNIKYKVNVMLSCILLSLSIPASATLFNFGMNSSDFTTQNSAITYGNVVDGASMSLNGIQLDLTPVLVNIDTHALTSLPSAEYTSGGMWVGYDSLGVTTTGGGTHIDGGNPYEGILFTFDHAVSLDSITFNAFDTVSTPGTNYWNDDGFNLLVNGNNIMKDVRSLDTNSYIDGWGAGDQPLFTGVTGTQFVVWADNSYDRFRVDRLSVSAVPEPSVLALFGLGLLGISVMIRRQKVYKDQ